MIALLQNGSSDRRQVGPRTSQCLVTCQQEQADANDDRCTAKRRLWHHNNQSVGLLSSFCNLYIGGSIMLALRATLQLRLNGNATLRTFPVGPFALQLLPASLDTCI